MGVIFALISALSFSFNNVFIRKGMEKSKSDNGHLITVFVNVIFLGLVALCYRIFITNVPISLYGIILFALAGVFTTFLGRFALFASFREIGPSRGVAIKNSAPLFTILFAIIFLNEVIQFLPLIGILIVLLGLAIQGYFLLRQNPLQNSQLDTKLKKGYFLALFSALVFGIGQAIRKPGIDELPDPFLGAFVSSLAAVIIILFWDWRKGLLRKTIKTQISTFNFYYLLSGLTSSLAMTSFFTAIIFIQVSIVSAIAAIEPLITIILSRFILRKEEDIALHTVFSAIFVFLGIIIIISFS